jgi:hypothetical protein
MSNFDPDGPADNEWDDRGDLAWNEFDWEHYLREQDDIIHRYLAFYEQLKGHPDRIDEAAHFMGWDREDWSSEGADDEEDAGAVSEDEAADRADISDYDAEPYTLHKNPVFVASRAIFLSLKRGWERIATDSQRVPQALAIGLQTSLYRSEEHALLAIQALDFGDYAMAISLLKRAHGELNQTLALLNSISDPASRSLLHFREDALPRLFDLREIWLRVMHECRQELGRPPEPEEEE